MLDFFPGIPHKNKLVQFTTNSPFVSDSLSTRRLHLFYHPKEESSQITCVGGGAGRSASIFGADASLLATLQGHTGWVRDVLFHDGQLYSYLERSRNSKKWIPRMGVWAEIGTAV